MIHATAGPSYVAEWTRVKACEKGVLVGCIAAGTDPQQVLEQAARAVVRKRNSAEGNERQEREN